jgi:hypothetical protein
MEVHCASRHFDWSIALALLPSSGVASVTTKDLRSSQAEHQLRQEANRVRNEGSAESRSALWLDYPSVPGLALSQIKFSHRQPRDDVFEPVSAEMKKGDDVTITIRKLTGKAHGKCGGLLHTRRHDGGRDGGVS